MRRCLVVLAMLLLFSGVCRGDLSSAKEEGKRFGKQTSKKGWKGEKGLEWMEGDFDPSQARDLIKRGVIPQNEVLDYLTSEEVRSNTTEIDDQEPFLKRSERMLENQEEGSLEETLDFTHETCQMHDAPYPLTVIRDLEVEVTYDPGMTKDVRICQGHKRDEKFSKKKAARNTAKKWEQEFSGDPSIKEFKVKIKDKGVLHKHVVKATWVHLEDASICRNYQAKTESISDPRWEEVGERWIYNNPNLFEQGMGPHCTYLEKICLDSTPSKTINGKEVSRQCWKEQLTFLCKTPNLEESSFLKEPLCELIQKTCLQKGPYGCTLWDLHFQCFTKIHRKQVGEGSLFGMDDQPEYEPNESFSEVAAKLAVFDEIKKELEESQAHNASTIQVFKGQKMECGKSVVDDALYDCCFNHSGLAKKLGLKHCSAEEITLSEMREQDLCYYIGSYPKEFLDLWKSRDEHVFCCFSSKLSRILHEQARPQLQISWGSPKHPDCRGLSLEEISRINFSQMDFSELCQDYEKKLPANFESKLDSFAQKVSQKVKEAHENS